MDAQTYSNLHWSFNMHICMFSPEVVHFFMLLCCYFSVKCTIHVLHLTMFRCVGDVNKNRKQKMVVYLLLFKATFLDFLNREYARGRRERRNRFTPAEVAIFSSESDKNVALIFRKIRCFIIHFNIHTCHQLVFDLGRSSTRYPSGLHKKSIRGRGPVWEGS